MRHSIRSGLLLFWVCLFVTPGRAQDPAGTIRGEVFDVRTGEPVSFAALQLAGTSKGTSSDLEGFFTLADIPSGNYTLQVQSLGYQDTSLSVQVGSGTISFIRITLRPTVIELGTFELSARRQRARNEVQISTLQVSSEEIQAMPSIGGEADVSQYLTVLPGIVNTGDQGGQLFIRGGAPVQNRILLDGIPIYNAFHSIGFFSVFETETIRSMDVYSAGFNAEYGGRISAVVDVKTREGNKKQWSGQVGASPFQAKVLLEGPLKPFNEKDGTSISLLVSGKQSLIDRTAPSLYAYAQDSAFFAFALPETSGEDLSDLVLPYQFRDLFGKLSFTAGKGSRLDLVGFHFTDEFSLLGLTELGWETIGAGANFRIVPPASDIIIDGSISYSDYQLELTEQDGLPRRSGIENFMAQLQFSVFGDRYSLQYGFDYTGFNTNFAFQNLFGIGFGQVDFTSEMAGFVRYKQQFDRLIIEPGLRLHYYASQSYFSIEPRLGLKYALNDRFRLKAGGGRYAQNVLGTQNDLDVINFFNGFLAGPEETIFTLGTRTPAANRLQTAWHAVAGLEWELGDQLQVNLEGYRKDFTQLITINRNKRTGRDPNFITETGAATGLELSARLEYERGYLWGNYGLSYVDRNDGEQTYPTVFDRRHNLNLLAVYQWGKSRDWSFSLRWNFGSAFPFTQTQGFFQDIPFQDLLQTDPLTGNFPIGTILSEQRNGGRLSAYHRLDLGLKRTIHFGERGQLEINAGLTNAYNRENIFYVDRLSNARVNQLPILPSLGVQFSY